MKGLQSGIGLGSLTNHIENVENFIESNFGSTEIDLDTIIDDFLASISDQLLSILANAVSVVSVIVIIPFVVFFFLKDGRNMKKPITTINIKKVLLFFIILDFKLIFVNLYFTFKYLIVLLLSI